jgi:hypothetical protein
MCTFKGVHSYTSDQMSLTVNLFLNMAVKLHLRKFPGIEVKIFSEAQDF